MEVVLKKIYNYLKDNPDAIIAGVVVNLGLFLGYYFNGKAWKIEYVEFLKIGFYSYSIISLITFLTIGARLYKKKFYLKLRYASKNKSTFKENKKIIWIVLTSAVAISLITITNFIISIVYNIFTFLCYILPGVFINIAFAAIFLLLKNYKKGKVKNTP